MHVTLELSPRNLSRLALLNGYRDVGDLAARLKRHRVTLYHALRDPEQYGPTCRVLREALPNRRVIS